MVWLTAYCDDPPPPTPSHQLNTANVHGEPYSCSPMLIIIILITNVNIDRKHASYNLFYEKY